MKDSLLHMIAYSYHKPNSSWCKFYLNTKSKSVIIVSDHGCWYYAWGNMGVPGDLRTFLVNSDTPYLTDKFGMEQKNEFNLKKTIEGLREQLEDMSDFLGETDTAELRGLIDEWHSTSYGPEGLYLTIQEYESDYPDCFFNLEDFEVYDYPAGLNVVMKEFLPLLQEELKGELDAEGN